MADPMYRFIADDLRRRIESGELKPGEQLPTEGELKDQYDASRNTVRDAVKRLMRQGLVNTKPGRGTFVVDKIVPFDVPMFVENAPDTELGESPAYVSAVEVSGRRPRIGRPQIEIHDIQDRPDVAQALQIAPDATVVSRHQRRWIDEKPWSLQTTFYPMGFVERGANRLLKTEDIAEGAVAYLQETLGVKQSGYRDQIAARTANPGETDFFGISDSGNLIMIEARRTSYDTKGRPIRYTVTTFPADRNQLTYLIGDVPEEQAGPGRPEDGPSLGGDETPA